MSSSVGCTRVLHPFHRWWWITLGEWWITEQATWKSGPNPGEAIAPHRGLVRVFRPLRQLSPDYAPPAHPVIRAGRGTFPPQICPFQARFAELFAVSTAPMNT